MFKLMLISIKPIGWYLIFCKLFLPLFQVTYDEEYNAIGFIRNAQHFAPNHTVLMYNLGLGQTELENVRILFYLHNDVEINYSV